MKIKDIEREAERWISAPENQIHVYAKCCSRDAFIAGAQWMAGFLCRISFDRIVIELHEYCKEKSKETT